MDSLLITSRVFKMKLFAFVVIFTLFFVMCNPGVEAVCLQNITLELCNEFNCASRCTFVHSGAVGTCLDTTVCSCVWSC